MATVVAATVPERIRGLILVDNCGLYNKNATSVTDALRTAILQYPKVCVSLDLWGPC